MRVAAALVLASVVAGCGAPPEPATTPEATVAPAPDPPRPLRTTWSGSFAPVELDLRPAAQGVVVEDGRPLVLVGPEQLVVVPAEGEPRIIDNAIGYRPELERDHTLPVAGGVFLIDGGDSLAALDLESLHVRWTAPHDRAVAHRCSAGDVFIESSSQTVRALDPSDGRELWRRPGPSRGALGAAGRGLVLLEDHEVGAVIGLDARTGRESFRVPANEPRVSRLSAHGFAIVGPRSRLVSVIGLDGEVRRRITLDADADGEDGVHVGEHDLTVIVRPARRAIEVRRYPLEGAGAPARSGHLPSSRAGARHLAVTEGGVWLLDDGVVRALDRDLRETWLADTDGSCSALAPWAAHDGAPAALVCGGRSTTVYRATPQRVPRRSITIRGLVRCDGRPLPDAPVRVASALVTTGDDGRYRVRAEYDQPPLRVSVPYPVWLDDALRCEPTERGVEPVEDELTVDLDLDLDVAGGGLEGI